MKLKSVKIDPPGFTTGLFDFRIGSSVFFERDCFVESFWGALGSDFGAYPTQNVPKSGHRAPQKLSTKQSRSKKYAGADSEVEKASCEA